MSQTLQIFIQTNKQTIKSPVNLVNPLSSFFYYIFNCIQFVILFAIQNAKQILYKQTNKNFCSF